MFYIICSLYCHSTTADIYALFLLQEEILIPALSKLAHSFLPNKKANCIKEPVLDAANNTQHNDIQHKGLIYDTQHKWHLA
jgi:hypothetical protein